MPDLVTFGAEPAAERWTVASWTEIIADLAPGQRPTERPLVIAVDGHSGSGKSTVAAHLAATDATAVIVHTDDVAWWESYFGWDHLLREGVLRPARAGEAVTYRPPAWDARGREGSIDVPAGTRLLVVEGVGASRRSLTSYLDAAVWVQSDYAESNRRGIARDAELDQGPDFWWQWMAEENPFLLDDRPWERAAVVVCGTPDLLGIDHDPAHEVLRGHLAREVPEPAAEPGSAG